MRSLEGVVFILSALLLTYFYGYLSATWDWFPAGILDRAGQQAKSLGATILDVPDYTEPRV